MAHGGRLYLDVVDHKPPAIYWLYAAAHRIAAEDVAMWLIHVLLILVVWSTALVLGAIARRCAPERPAAPTLASALYIVFTMTMMSFDGLAANAELWMMLPASVSVLLVLDDPAGTTRAFAAGMLLSIAAAFKYQAGIQAPLLIGMLAMHGAVSLGARARNVAIAGIGMALPWIAMVLWFKAHGTLDEALYWFRFNFAYIGAGTERGEMLRRAIPRIAFVVGPAILLYAGAAGALPSMARDRVGRWVVLWAVLSAAATAAGGRFFGHYFHQLSAPLAVLAAVFLARFVDVRLGSRVVAATLTLPALAFWIVDWSHDAVMRDIVHHPDPNYAAVVRWLDADDSSRGALCVWGNSPQLVALARRPQGCRFVSANFLTGLSPATASQTDPSVDASPNIVPGMWPRFVADLGRLRPRYIVDGSPGNVAYFGKFPPEKYAQLRTILEREYEPAAVVEGMRIFRRRAGI